MQPGFRLYEQPERGPFHALLRRAGAVVFHDTTAPYWGGAYLLETAA